MGLMVYNSDISPTLRLGYLDSNDTHMLQYVIASERVSITLFDCVKVLK
jgi:hypothetical protein